MLLPIDERRHWCKTQSVRGLRMRRMQTWKKGRLGYWPFDFIGVSPRVAEMKVLYTVVKPTKTTKTREKLTETYAEFSKAQVTYAPHSHRPTPIQAQPLHPLSNPSTKPQHLLPFSLTQHRSQHRIEMTYAHKWPPFVPNLPRI